MNILKGILAFVICLVVVIGVFIIYSMIAEMADSRPFQEIEDLANLLFYMPVFIIYIVWFMCIATYFKPIKISSKFKTFAEPDGEKFETTIDRSKKDRIRLILTLGTILGLILIFLATGAMVASCCEPASVNWYRESLRADAKPAFKSMSQRLEKQLSDRSENIDTGTWQNVFESDLDCFEPERSALETAMNFTNNFIMRFDNYLFIDYKAYEFWIDPKDKSHFKIRYNSELNDRMGGHRISYDGLQNRFYIVGTRPFNYEYREIYPYSSYMGVFEYDSITKEYSFIYDNDWDNFKENYKWVIFLSVYILTAIICISMVFICKLIHKYRTKNNIISPLV